MAERVVTKQIVLIRLLYQRQWARCICPIHVQLVAGILLQVRIRVYFGLG